MTCVFYSCFDCYIPFAFKESLCFLHWILHYFLCLKPLALFCRYYSLELEIYISFSCVGFGLFWTWNACVIHVVLSLSLIGWFLFPFACWFFQCLVGKIGSSFPYLFQREVLVFSLFCFIRKLVEWFYSCFVQDCLKFEILLSLRRNIYFQLCVH